MHVLKIDLKKILSILIVLNFALIANAQSERVTEDVKLYYRSSVAFGLAFHTAGWGGSFKYYQHLSYKIKRFYTFEYQNLKHPKQEKVTNAFDDNAKSFFYSKINSFTHARLGIGGQRAFALKELKKGIQVSWIYSGGLNLGFLKPIYLEVYDLDNAGQRVEERYDPEVHTIGVIYGRGSYLKGFDEMQFVPGIYGKFGLNFEYSPYDERIKSMEVGVAVDLFYKEVPLMYNTYNNQYWITFYLMFELGKKLE